MNELYRFEAMPGSEAEFLEEVSRLETIDSLDVLQGNLPFSPEEQAFVELLPDSPQQPWKDIHFKRHLSQFIKAKYKRRVKISDKFAEKVYRDMYRKRIQENYRVSRYMKVFFHPDITRADYNFLQNCQRKQYQYIIFSQILMFSGISYSYFKGNLKKIVQKNIKAGIGICMAPLLTIFAISAGYPLVLQRKAAKAGLFNKYGLE